MTKISLQTINLIGKNTALEWDFIQKIRLPHWNLKA